MEDEYQDDEAEVFLDDEMWARWHADLFEADEFEHQATRIEDQQYDAWIDRRENETNAGRSKNWHHDADQIWQLEDNLRKGWR